jgi:ketosteroid isomerase-like protein
MKIPLVVALAGLVIGFSLPTFAQQKDTVDPQTAQQVRVLAMKYDEAMNKHDAAAIASLYTQNGVKESDFGTSHGRQSIEKSYAKYEFQRWPVSNFSTRVNRVIKAGNELRSTGTWSGVFTNHSGGHDNDGGYYAWALVRDGDTWKIRKNTTHGAGNPFGTNFSQKSQKWPAFGLSRMARRQG